VNAEHSSSSRRSFLKYSAAFAGAAMVMGPAARRLLAADNAEYGGLRMGIQSYSLRDRSFDKMLEAMQNDFKCHVVEIYPQHVTGLSPKQAMDKAAAANVTITSYGVVAFTKDNDKNRKQFDIAKAYNLKTLSCNPDDNKETFDSLEKLTEEYDVPIAIHPHGPGSTWPTAEKLRKAFDGRSKRIGLCADTGHLIRSGEDPLKVIQEFKDRTYSLHLKDFKKTQKNGKDNWEDVPAGTANLDVDAIVKYLIKEKWSGNIYIEYEGGNPVEAVKQSLERVKEAAKKANA
jgi:sugar phosphate isomerase/epimerase